MNLKEFARRIRIIGQGVEDNARELVVKTALAIDQVLVTSTPVDTGRARSNWRVSIGVGLTEEIEAYVLGVGGDTGGANAAAALQNAKQVLQEYKGGSAVYISNNLPYITALNEGSSAQAPAGFVELAVQEASSVIKGARLVR